MSISGISGSNFYTNALYNQQNQNQQTQNNFSQMQTDFAQLGADLQSGNLTQAQSDYSNIQSLQQSMHAHHGHHHGGGGGGIEALLQALNNSDSSSSTTAQNTSTSNSSSTSSDSANQLLASIQNLISQYMQNMESGYSNQENQAGNSSLMNIIA